MANSTTLPSIKVTGGSVRGVKSQFDPSIILYLGVPYAGPPTGENRWKAPQPILPWEGTKKCDTIAPSCPQAAPNPKYIDVLKGHPQSEDCLYLNIYRPSDTEPHNKPFPVFVWYHGGGFREGGSADPNFDGTGLAQKGVIVVVPSFRLSVFGYFAHPELSAASPSGTSGMEGMLDAIEVLKWIKANISSFGGNPDQVTIAGQSAGSAMCHTILSSPLAKGLVHGVVLQSGAARAYREPAVANGPMSYRSLKEAEEDGVALLKELGLKDITEFRRFNDLEKLREISMRRDDRCWGPPPLFRLVCDGYVIPKSWSEMAAGGSGSDIPVMVGMNGDEGGTYNEPRFTYEDFLECVEGRFGPSSTYGRGDSKWVKQFLELYQPQDKESGKGPLEAWNKASRENTRNNLSLWAKDYHQKTNSPVWGYYFTHPITPWANWEPDFGKKILGFTNQKGPVTGAFHGAEYPYTFNSLITNNLRPWTETDRTVGQKVSTIWANFAKYGNPNGANGKEGQGPDGVGRMPNLNEEPNSLLELGGNWKPIETVDEERRNFWNAYVASQKAW